MSDAADEQAAWLEQIRRSGIRVDREGRFVHEGAEVTHEGLKRALYRWLDRLPPPDGRYVLRLDERRFAYLDDVADTPLVARAARIDDTGAIQLALSDGSEERLDPETLTLDEDGVLRAWVRRGRIEARLATSAAAVLADLMQDPETGPAPPAMGSDGQSPSPPDAELMQDPETGPAPPAMGSDGQSPCPPDAELMQDAQTGPAGDTIVSEGGDRPRLQLAGRSYVIRPRSAA
jgi:hypothetical protein